MGAKETPAGRARIVREVVRAYTYVLLWMSISCAVILFNKWLLAYSGFPFPIALTLWHMAVCSTVGILAVRVLRLVKSHNMSTRDYCRRVMPIGKSTRAPRAWLPAAPALRLPPTISTFCHCMAHTGCHIHHACVLRVMTHALCAYVRECAHSPYAPSVASLVMVTVTQPACQPHLYNLAGLLYAGSLWLSNSAYLHLSVSFIQMTKSLMPGKHRTQLAATPFT